MKQIAVNVLRALRLLPLAERIRYMLDVARTHTVNREYRRLHPEIQFPPTWIAYDAYRSCGYDRYYNKGQHAATEVYQIYDALLPRTAEPETRILEWGCGPGRVIRHLPRLDASRRLRVSGCDYNADSIHWCQKAIVECEFALNQLHPPLPYPDDSLDFLYSISVYTHLSQKNQTAWLHENLRVVRPGGFVMLTVHGDNFRGRLTSAERGQYDKVGVVERAKVLEGSRLFSTFNSTDYMMTTMLAGRRVVMHDRNTRKAFGGQDIFVVEKT
jgi:SAM-dependent methyltransferase